MEENDLHTGSTSMRSIDVQYIYLLKILQHENKQILWTCA